MSPQAGDLIQDFLRRHPGGEESDVIRATALVYFDVLRDQKQVKRVEEIFNHADYQEKLKTTARKTKVRFKPALYIDIEACASAFNFTPSKVVSEGLKRIMACYHMAVPEPLPGPDDPPEPGFNDVSDTVAALAELRRN